MKRRSIIFYVLLLLFLIIGYGISAQEIKTLPEVKVISSVKVPDKVTEAFKGDFQKAVGMKWFRLNRDFLVKFIQDDMKHNALYQKNGYLRYDISYGNESNLPEDIRIAVKSNYKEYDITHAINVKEDNRNIWVVNLEKPNRFVIVRWEEGEVEEVQNLKGS